MEFGKTANYADNLDNSGIFLVYGLRVLSSGDGEGSQPRRTGVKHSLHIHQWDPLKKTPLSTYSAEIPLFWVIRAAINTAQNLNAENPNP